MILIRYDESETIKSLERLPARLRVAFASLCAERLLPAYITFCEQTKWRESRELVSILMRLWRDLEGENLSVEEVHVMLNVCIGLIPKSDEPPGLELQAYAEDASAAVAYALRTRQNGSSQEAAWAALRVYEALDSYVIEHEGINPYEPGGGERVLAHSLIQAELLRQRRDLDDLLQITDMDDQAPFLARLRARAEVDAIRFFGETNA